MPGHPLFGRHAIKHDEAMRKNASEQWHVKRVRITDPNSGDRGSELSTPSQGAVRYSKTFNRRDAAQHEADSWNNVGDWRATVEHGKAPK